LADQLDQLVLDRALCVALAISLEVAQVTDVTLLVRWSTVGLSLRVDCGSGRKRSVGEILTEAVGSVKGILTVRAGAGAAVGVVAIGMDVHATLSVGIMASDVP